MLHAARRSLKSKSKGIRKKDQFSALSTDKAGSKSQRLTHALVDIYLEENLAFFMQIIRTHYHPDVESLEDKTVFTRLATRGIAIQGEDILLLYTERYEDYSLPGGGLDMDEDKIVGMMRELTEETGAKDIVNIKPFGAYEEYRPWYKEDYDIQHMISYCYTCEINKELGESKMESYELKNGMRPVWVNIHEAIKHNKNTMASSEKKGMSLERETFLLELIASSL